jgi:hypothetical protein
MLLLWCTISSKISVFTSLLLPLLRLLLPLLLPSCPPPPLPAACKDCRLIPMLLRLVAAAFARLAVACLSGLLTARVVCGCCSRERREALPFMLEDLPTPPFMRLSLLLPPLLLIEARALAAALSSTLHPPRLLPTLGFCRAAAAAAGFHPYEFATPSSSSLDESLVPSLPSLLDLLLLLLPLLRLLPLPPFHPPSPPPSPIRAFPASPPCCFPAKPVPAGGMALRVLPALPAAASVQLL